MQENSRVVGIVPAKITAGIILVLVLVFLLLVVLVLVLILVPILFCAAKTDFRGLPLELPSALRSCPPRPA